MSDLSPILSCRALLLGVCLGVGALGCDQRDQPDTLEHKADGPAVISAVADATPDFPAHLAQPPVDPREAITKALDSRELANDGDDLAFLRDMLKVAGVPEASQVMVFSLTSHQDHIISRTNPRAIYFSDDAYLGYVPAGIIEYSDVDPDEGTGFFILDQRIEAPHTLKSVQSCLLCHEGGRTGNRRGLLVRSVFVGDNGFPIASGGSFFVSHDTPMKDRWGGWYVTGEHGQTRHMGNVIATEADDGRRPTLDRESGANVTDLSPYFNVSKYLRPTSDIVALMVLEHQVVMHNLLTQGAAAVNEQANRSASIAQQYNEPFDPASADTLQLVIRSQTERIVRHMLFANEITLDDPIVGDATFARQFRANRREDTAGRSLKDFDLDTRMFKYRCSYMIYSRAFRELPGLLKGAVYARLAAGLNAESEDELFAHLDAAEREAIATILQETHAGYAAFLEANEASD